MADGVLRQVTEIQALSLRELRERWSELFGTDAPRYSRAALIRRLAYRIQELAFGGVTEATRARLREHLKEVDGIDGPARMTRRGGKGDGPVAGTRFIREWRGQRYEVTVVPGGCEWEGRRYRSLSEVARAITGTRWNGPLFFGLRTRKAGG